MNVFREIFEDIKSDVGAREIQETMTRSDLPYFLLGTALDRALLKAYREYPADWEGYVYHEKAKDFRTVERLYEFGGEGALERVRELAPYEYAKLQEGKYTFSVAKYGRKIGFSWESYKNDDLGVLKRIPEKLARGARRTEHRLITSLFVDSSGPKSALFSASPPKSNLGTAALSITALQAGFEAIGAHKDENGEPIYTENVHLVVPPSLEITGKSIINAIELQYTEAEGAFMWKTTNWMKTRITLHVNPYLPIINTTNGTTAWFLFPEPSDIEVLVMAKLTDHEEPEIFMKNPNAVKLGGGEDVFGGDFDTDSIEYKVRHICGGALFDWRGCYASTGAGSAEAE